MSCWGLGQEAFNELIHIPTLVILARLLSPHEFGVTAAAGFFMNFANRFTKFGFNIALVRMKHMEAQHSSSVFVVSVAMGLASWAALTLGSPWIGRFFNSPETGQVLPIAALTFIIASVGSVPSALLTRDFRYREKTVVDWSGTLTYSVVAVALAWSGWSFWSLVYADVARTTVLTTASLHSWPLAAKRALFARRDARNAVLRRGHLRKTPARLRNAESRQSGRWPYARAPPRLGCTTRHLPPSTK